MKILDRHVLLSFLRNYLISFMVLIGLYVTLDMVFQFDEFAKVGRKAGVEGIDKLLRDNDVVALVGPTMPPAWLIDAVNGDQIAGGGAGGLAAVAGYPHLTVPMGAVKGLPVGLSFIGAKWDDARILSLGYAYEQASRKIVTPRFLASIEDAQPVKALPEPTSRSPR